MILTKFCNRLLLCGVILRSDNLIHPPFVAGCGGKHTSHQMISPVCITECMKRIIFVHTELRGGNKNRSACSKRDITSAVSHSSGCHCGCRIVSGTGCNLYLPGNTKLCRNGRKQGSDTLIALIELRQHLLCYMADFTHLLRPAAVLDIQKQHAGSVRYIGAVLSGKLVCKIILRKHNLFNSCKILRLFISHPEKF